MEIKLVISDVDGTLVDQTEMIPKELCETLTGLRKRNIRFSLATGRTKELMDSVARKIGVTDPCVAANGACIFEGDRCIVSHGFLAGPVVSILKNADLAGLTVTLADEWCERAVRQTDYVLSHQRIGGRFQTYIDLNTVDWGTSKFQKIMIMDEHRTGKIREFQTELSKYSADYWITAYSDAAVELGPKACNKATGLKELTEILGIELSNVMACGDFSNDLEMIKEAGIGVAVGNASEELKRAANYTAKGQGAFGVIEAIEKFCFREV